MAKPSVDHIPNGGFVLLQLKPFIMSTPNEDDANSERRAKGRTTINRSAQIYFTGDDRVHSCSVRDVTNDGAGIRLSGVNVMPTAFDLSFDNFRTIRKGHLIWRDGDFVGATLES